MRISDGSSDVCSSDLPSKGEERTVLCNVGHSEAATKEQAAGTSPSPSGDIVRRAPKYPAPGSGTNKVFSAGAGTVRRQAADGKAGMEVPADAEPGIRRMQSGGDRKSTRLNSSH